MVSPDVIVVGAGPCGAAVASGLLKRGRSIVMLEAGRMSVKVPMQRVAHQREYRKLLEPYLALAPELWTYETNCTNYDWIRVRAPGGRTLRWNGWLVKPEPSNFLPVDNWRPAWPLGISKLEQLFARSLVWLNGQKTRLSPRFLDLQNQLGSPVVPKTAAIGQDGVRPFCSLDPLFKYLHTGEQREGVQLVQGAVVTNLLFDGKRVAGVEYLDLLNGQRHCLKARAVVLAASAIETTRLLLASSEVMQIATGAHLIGQGYTDHIAASYLAILPEPFEGELPGGPLDNAATIPRPRRSRRTRAQRGGFTIELHGPNPVSIYEPEVLAVAGLDPNKDKAVSCISVNAIGELCPMPHRFVSLSNRTDSLGRRIPYIGVDWDAEVSSLANKMEAEACEVATLLAGKGGTVMKVRETLSLGGTGTSHEAGTCVLGSDPYNSVVNLEGQVHGTEGLFVADASLLPTGLDCHPTLTIIGLALNTADGVARNLD